MVGLFYQKHLLSGHFLDIQYIQLYINSIYQLRFKFELGTSRAKRAFQDCSSIITGFTLLTASSALLGKIPPARNTPRCINTNRQAVLSEISFNILTKNSTYQVSFNGATHILVLICWTNFQCLHVFDFLASGGLIYHWEAREQAGFS